jgi:hypothetical protein
MRLHAAGLAQLTRERAVRAGLARSAAFSSATPSCRAKRSSSMPSRRLSHEPASRRPSSSNARGGSPTGSSHATPASASAS